MVAIHGIMWNGRSRRGDQAEACCIVGIMGSWTAPADHAISIPTQYGPTAPSFECIAPMHNDNDDAWKYCDQSYIATVGTGVPLPS